MMKIKMFLMLVLLMNTGLFAASNTHEYEEDEDSYWSSILWDEYVLHDRAKLIELSTPKGYEFDYQSTMSALRGIGTGPFYKKIEFSEVKKD